MANANATTAENKTKSLRIFVTLSHLAHVELAWAGPAVAARTRAELVPLRPEAWDHSSPPPQPGLRHLGKGHPRIAVSERGGRFEALLCPPPILVCPTQHCHSSPFVR